MRMNALAAVGAREAVDPLIRLIPQTYRNTVQRAIADALDQIDIDWRRSKAADEAASLCVRRLQSRQTNGGEVYALRELRNRKAIPQLIDVLESSSSSAMKSAEVALQVITGEKWGEDPAAWREWWERQEKR